MIIEGFIVRKVLGSGRRGKGDLGERILELEGEVFGYLGKKRNEKYFLDWAIRRYWRLFRDGFSYTRVGL